MARISFQEASSQEAFDLQQHMIFFYSEQLFDAGLFEDLGAALKAAIAEWQQEGVDNPNQEIYYYHLVSKDFSIRYGYLVYSLNDRIAHLDALYLEKAYRGLGFGKQVLQNLEVELKQTEIAAISLYVFAHNIAAFTLYDRMGYLIKTTYSDGSKPIGYHMQKNLQREEENTPI